MKINNDINLIQVETAEEMFKSTQNNLPVDVAIFSAAVADFKIKEKNKNDQNLDFLINNLRPSIFWKEKPLLKKQLGLWNLKNLKKN